MIRTEVFLGGRLTKIYQQTELRWLAGRNTQVDGAHHWEIDGAEIAEDVALLLLAHGAELRGLSDEATR